MRVGLQVLVGAHDLRVLLAVFPEREVPRDDTDLLGVSALVCDVVCCDVADSGLFVVGELFELLQGTAGHVGDDFRAFEEGEAGVGKRLHQVRSNGCLA